MQKKLDRLLPNHLSHHRCLILYISSNSPGSTQKLNMSHKVFRAIHPPMHTHRLRTFTNGRGVWYIHLRIGIPKSHDKIVAITDGLYKFASADTMKSWSYC